jgi:hypothetical protein
MIDLTNELAVAAFFATHCYDGVTKSYHLVKEGIGQIRTTCEFFFAVPDQKSALRPVGVQPFSRPSNQYGYGYWIDENDDFVNHSSVIQFRQDYEVNRRLNNAMAGPQTMYFPNEEIVQMASVIKKENVVTRNAVEVFANDANKEYILPIVTKEEIIEVLEKHHVFITDAPVICPEALPRTLHPFVREHQMVRRPVYQKGMLL